MFVFCRILCSVGQFSPWGRFWSNRMEIAFITVIAFLAVTVFWPVRCRVNGLYLSVVTETILHALPTNRLSCNALLLQSYSLLWKRVATIRHPAVDSHITKFLFKRLISPFPFFPSLLPSIDRSDVSFCCSSAVTDSSVFLVTLPLSRVCITSPAGLPVLLGISVVTVEMDATWRVFVCVLCCVIIGYVFCLCNELVWKLMSNRMVITLLSLKLV
jgi:hypothetical protein